MVYIWVLLNWDQQVPVHCLSAVTGRNQVLSFYLYVFAWNHNNCLVKVPRYERITAHKNMEIFHSRLFLLKIAAFEIGQVLRVDTPVVSLAVLTASHLDEAVVQ